jgi:hypothetical protein
MGKTLSSQEVSWGAKSPNVLHGIFSSSCFSESIKGMSRFSYNSGAYNEQAFRYLLTSESKRSERSGHSFNILLIYSTDKQGLIVQMDRDVAATVFKALFRTLRETDYIGWYRETHILGGVLTVLGQDSAVEVSVRIQQRVMDILRVAVSVEKNRRLQIRICEPHTMEKIEFREGISSVT